MEENMNINNEIKNIKNTNSTIIIIILAILLVGALGFICYDKFINKEKPSIPIPTPTATPVNNEKEEEEIIKVDKYTYKTVELSQSNKIVQFDNQTFKLRIDKYVDYDMAGGLYINDKAIMNKEYDDVLVHAGYAFVTNEYILFFSYGQCDRYIGYAIDSKGNELKINSGSYQMHDIRVEINKDNKSVVATGYDCWKAVENDDNTTQKLLITYNNDTITVAPKK